MLSVLFLPDGHQQQSGAKAKQTGFQLEVIETFIMVLSHQEFASNSTDRCESYTYIS